MKRISTLGLVLVIGVVSLANAKEAKAATYYAAPAGSGSVCSLTAACNLTTGLGKLVAGDTLYLRQGNYNQQVSFSQSGTAAAWITISGYPGETAAIDGNYTIPATLYDFLVVIRGSYVRVQNLQVTRSKQDAMMITGNYSQAVNVAVHDNYASGLIMVGSYNVADRVTIYNNSQDYAGCAWKSGYTRWGGALSCGPGSKYGMIKNSVVYNNWGEGISSYSSGNSISDHCTIQDNVTYDNGSVMLYLQNSTNDLVQRNLIYRTANTPLACAANIGLQLGNESTGVCTTGSTIINNLVMGTWMTFNVDVCTFSGHLSNAVIANNTFVNGIPNPGYDMGVYFRSYPTPNIFENVLFANNIIVQENGLKPITVQTSHPGLTFSHNLYNTAYSSDAAGVGDIIADPKLLRAGTFSPGTLTADWFRLTSLSPSIDKGLSLTQSTTDYFNNTRVGATDLGAIEYNGVNPTAGTALPTATVPPPAPTLPPVSTVTAAPMPTVTAAPTGINAPTPTTPPTISCSSFKTTTSQVLPALVSAGSQMQISCDYGVSGVSCGMPYYFDSTNTSYSYPCTQTAVAGTVVKYNCTAPASLGSFNNACRLVGGGSCQEGYCMSGSFKVLTPGDVNGDGLVNGTDLSIWLNNLGKVLNTGAAAGDFNGDGVVDGKDYLIWMNHA